MHYFELRIKHSGSFEYENAQLSYINIPDGRYVVSTGKYEYNLTDHPPVDGHNPTANKQALSNKQANSIHFPVGRRLCLQPIIKSGSCLINMVWFRLFSA